MMYLRFFTDNQSFRRYVAAAAFDSTPGRRSLLTGLRAACANFVWLRPAIGALVLWRLVALVRVWQRRGFRVSAWRLARYALLLVTVQLYGSVKTLRFFKDCEQEPWHKPALYLYSV